MIEMTMFDAILSAVAPFGVDAKVKKDEMFIINRENSRFITVYEEKYYEKSQSNQYTEYIVEFSTQHRHFDSDNSDEIIEYILEIMNDKALPIEFYLDGKRRFGGEMRLKEYLHYSIKELLSNHGYNFDSHNGLCYEITSWSGKYDTGMRELSEE